MARQPRHLPLLFLERNKFFHKKKKKKIKKKNKKNKIRDGAAWRDYGDEQKAVLMWQRPNPGRHDLEQPRGWAMLYVCTPVGNAWWIWQPVVGEGAVRGSLSTEAPWQGNYGGIERMPRASEAGRRVGSLCSPPIFCASFVPNFRCLSPARRCTKESREEVGPPLNSILGSSSSG